MDKLLFRTQLLYGLRSIAHTISEYNPVASVTDPTLAMSGSQLAYAAMLGQPIPQPPINYSFNSATRPEDVLPIDNMRADKFEVFSDMEKQRQNGVQDQFNAAIEQSKEYQQLKQKKDEK